MVDLDKLISDLAKEYGTNLRERLLISYLKTTEKFFLELLER